MRVIVETVGVAYDVTLAGRINALIARVEAGPDAARVVGVQVIPKWPGDFGGEYLVVLSTTDGAAERSGAA